MSMNDRSVPVHYHEGSPVGKKTLKGEFNLEKYMA